MVKSHFFFKFSKDSWRVEAQPHQYQAHKQRRELISVKKNEEVE